MSRKVCYFSVDFEEWFNIPFMKPYINEKNNEISYCSKVVPFFKQLKEENIPCTVFVVGCIAETYKKELLEIKELGNAFGVHSYKHFTYKYMSTREFLDDVTISKNKLEAAIGERVYGFRAPMFSASYEKLKELPKVGIRFDSSSINSSNNPFYVKINPNVWKSDTSGLKEYIIPTLWGKSLGGGGFFRSTPLWLYKIYLSIYLCRHSSFTFYIHTYEIVSDPFPGFPNKHAYGRFRFEAGRKTVIKKFWKLIKWLKKKGIEFDTMK